MQIDHFAYLVRNTDQSLQAIGHADHEVLVRRKPLESQQAFITLVRMADAAPPRAKRGGACSHETVRHRPLSRRSSLSGS